MWDLDNGTYLRLPGEGRSIFLYDRVEMKITRVDAWPKVGSAFLVWFDDPTDPLLEHWRRSSTVQRIERINEGPDTEASTDN